MGKAKALRVKLDQNKTKTGSKRAVDRSLCAVHESGRSKKSKSLKFN